MNLKLGDGIKLETYPNLYEIVYVERVIWGPDIVLLSNGKWYKMDSIPIKHGRSVYKADELAGDLQRCTLVITPRKCDLEPKIRWVHSIDSRPLEQIRPDEIIY